MKRSALINAAAIFSFVGLSAPLLAAGPPAASQANATNSSGGQAVAAKPAEKCLGDVRGLSEQMSKQGYWLGESGYGYGYPMGGYGYGYGTLGNLPPGNTAGYATARPGYEVRTLIASANILAQAGQEQPCQSVLAAARTVYTRYAADLHDRGVPLADQPGWQQRQIAAAQPVTGKGVAFRSDQLLDADVVSPGNETLGSVHDLVMSPQTGKIAYLIIARGGLFGIDQSYTPVPWEDFKATPDASLLVLDSTKAIVDAAPQARGQQFTTAGQFDAESKNVTGYWSSHVRPTGATN